MSTPSVSKPPTLSMVKQRNRLLCGKKNKATYFYFTPFKFTFSELSVGEHTESFLWSECKLCPTGSTLSPDGAAALQSLGPHGDSLEEAGLWAMGPLPDPLNCEQAATATRAAHHCHQHTPPPPQWTVFPSTVSHASPRSSWFS